MVYYFDKNKETEGLITLKESNTTVTINITTNKIQRKDHDIKIEYSIENEGLNNGIKLSLFFSYHSDT